MTSYEFTLPTTGAFFFPSCIREAQSEHNVLQIASTHRAQLRDVLKRLKRSDHKDILSVVRTIEEYLPSLFTIFHSLVEAASEEHTSDGSHAAKQFTLVKPIITSWRATLCDNKVPGKAFPRLDFRGITMEVNFVLLTYAYGLSNQALLPTIDGARATDLLSRAAGIFQYINNSVSPLLENTSVSRSCPEAFPELSACLASMSIGDAQMSAANHLKDKASFSVICRVAVGASDHYSKAIGILSSHPLLKSIPSDFRNSLSTKQRSALALAYQYLSREQAKLGHVGFAVGCAEQADKLQKLSGTTDLLRELNKENRQVTFQVVATADEVQSKLPSGRDFAKLVQFVEPQIGTSSSTSNPIYAGDKAYY